MAVFDKKTLELLGEPATDSGDAPVSGVIRALTGTGSDLMITGEAYEGASRFSRELAGYAPAIRSADGDLLPSKGISDARARDMGRNDAYVQGGATLRKDNIVGSYFMPNHKPMSRVIFGKEDTDWEDEFSEECEENFALDTESPDNWIDASGHNTLTEMVRMTIDQHTRGGESLASVEWLRANRRPCSTAIQLIDTDRLSTPPEFMGDDNVRSGVRRDMYGAAVGYYVRMSHPSDWRTPLSYEWKYVPVRKPWGRIQMIHIFEQMRPDQTRGIAAMVAALSEMKMMKNFRQMVLQNAVLNATYAATIESELPSEAIFARLGGDDSPEKIENMILNYVGGHFSAMDKYMGSSRNLKIDGLKIPHLPPGSKLNLRGAGQGGPLGTDFEQSLLRYIAAILGVSYEQLSRDYTNTNYSSARAAMNETHKAMLTIKRKVADRFATHVFRLWMEEQVNNGLLTTWPKRAPSIYEGRTFEAMTQVDWIGAARGQVDELKETQAAILRMSHGLSDLETENARMGFDWKKRFRQMKRENEWKEHYGVLPDPIDTKNQENSLTAAPRDKSGSSANIGTAGNLFMDAEPHEREEGDG